MFDNNNSYKTKRVSPETHAHKTNAHNHRQTSATHIKTIPRALSRYQNNIIQRKKTTTTTIATSATNNDRRRPHRQVLVPGEIHQNPRYDQCTEAIQANYSTKTSSSLWLSRACWCRSPPCRLIVSFCVVYCDVYATAISNDRIWN